MSGQILLGTQGWDYPAWVGPFYPVGSTDRDMLTTYARAFSTVEVDATFYRAPADAVVESWRDQVPGCFRFSLKVPQEITHERRLVDVREPLKHFLDRVSPLGDRLGAFLLQMPPDWRAVPASREALAAFLPLLPAEFRWAIEFRDPRWLTSETRARLADHGVALALADGRWIRPRALLGASAAPTADFAYVRWMGSDRRVGRNSRVTDYARVQIDRSRDTDRWCEIVRALAGRVRTIYGYFSNRYQGHSPQSARTLQAALGMPAVDPASLRIAPEPPGRA